jgi:hypothetical protein
MKTITIDMSDKVYKTFREFLELLPKDSFKIYDEDTDLLSVEEKEEYYSLQKKLEKGGLKDFEDWDNFKEQL